MAIKNKRLSKNIFSLSIIQFSNYLIPLIIFPYIIRVIGPEKYGLIAFAQAFIGYFSLIIDFGFNLSATKEIALNKDNKNELDKIFSNVIITKGLLFLLSFILFSIITICFDKFRKDWLIYYLVFTGLLGQLLSPTWFFQGIEKMKYITALDLISKSFFIFSIFIFVNKSSDYLIVPLLNSVSYIIAGIISITIILKIHKIKITIPSLKEILSQLKYGFHFFLSRLSVSAYTNSNLFILGLTNNNTIVGYYSIAEKIYMALKNLYTPINDSLYPYMSKEKDITLFRRLFLLCTITNILMMLILFIFSDSIIYLITGLVIKESIIALKIFLFACMITIPSVLIGYPFLASFGFPNYANNSVIISSGFHILMLIIFAFTGLLNIYTVVLLILITEILVFLLRIYYIYRLKLLPFKSSVT
jgi:PST family polysaccharide transporter